MSRNVDGDASLNERAMRRRRKYRDVRSSDSITAASPTTGQRMAAAMPGMVIVDATGRAPGLPALPAPRFCAAAPPKAPRPLLTPPNDGLVSAGVVDGSPYALLSRLASCSVYVVGAAAIGLPPPDGGMLDGTGAVVCMVTVAAVNAPVASLLPAPSVSL